MNNEHGAYIIMGGWGERRQHTNKNIIFSVVISSIRYIKCRVREWEGGDMWVTIDTGWSEKASNFSWAELKEKRKQDSPRSGGGENMQGSMKSQSRPRVESVKIMGQDCSLWNHLHLMWPGTSSFSSLNLILLICKMRTRLSRGLEMT